LLHTFNVPRSVVVHHGEVLESTSGPVRIPTVDGWYDSRLSFHPAYLSGCDVEPGHHWLVSVNPTYVAPQFLPPSQMEIERLPVDHTWVLHPKGDVESVTFRGASVVDDQSVTSRVASVIDDQDMNEIATQAGFLNASQAGPSNVAHVNFDHGPIISDGEFNLQEGNCNDDVVYHFFDSYEQMKKPALRSLAIAHGISMLVGKMSSDNLRQSIVCHVGRGYCSFSKHSYEGCDSVCKALHIESV